MKLLLPRSVQGSSFIAAKETAKTACPGFVWDCTIIEPDIG